MPQSTHTIDTINIRQYTCIFFDINGVLTQNGRLIKGSLEVLSLLRKKGVSIRLLTNCVSISTEQLYQNLLKLGLDIHRCELISALDVAKLHFATHHLKPYCLIHKNIKDQIKHYNKDDADCVLIGDARENFTYENLNVALNLLKQGVSLFSLGENRYFKSNEQLMLDTGAFTHLLQYASETNAQIFGKPETSFFKEALKNANTTASKCLMIGDDIYGDIQGANLAGIDGVLVKTGKYQKMDEQKIDNNPFLIDSVQDLLNQFK